MDIIDNDEAAKETQLPTTKKQGLQQRQRDFLASFFEKISLVLFTVLFAEPIISLIVKREIVEDEVINWAVVIVIILTVLIFMTYAVKLKKSLINKL